MTLAGLAYLPWLPMFVKQARVVAAYQEWWLPVPGVRHVAWSASHWVTFVPTYPLEERPATWLPPGSPTGWLAITTLLLVGCVLVAGARRREHAGIQGDSWLVVALWWVVPCAAAFAASHVTTPVFFPRFQLATVPALVLLVAAGCAALGGRRTAVAVAALVVLHGVALAHQLEVRTKERWDEVVEILKREGRDGDVVVLSSRFLQTPFAYHYRGDLPVVRCQDFDGPAEVLRALRADVAGFERAWLVEAFSKHGRAADAFGELVPLGPVETYELLKIRVSLYDLPPP